MGGAAVGVAPKAREWRGNEGWEEEVGDPKSQDALLEVPTTSITGKRSHHPHKALALRDRLPSGHLPCLTHLISQPGGRGNCHLPTFQRRKLRRSARRGRAGVGSQELSCDAGATAPWGGAGGPPTPGPNLELREEAGLGLGQTWFASGSILACVSLPQSRSLHLETRVPWVSSSQS